MSILQILIIALVQGITEWLPISSSAHVLLAADMFGLVGRDEVLINAMAHLGTLFAVLIYFWRDVTRAITGGVELLGAPFAKSTLSANARLALCIIVATPIALAVAAGYEAFVPDEIDNALRSLWTVAISTIVFGLLLWWADVAGKRERTVADMTLGHAVMIGATQAVAALIPGTSRSGITMTAARALGYARTDAARFSMLIGAPILAAVGIYAFIELAGLPEDAAGAATMQDGLMVAGLSFISGVASIHLLMVLLRRMSFLPFVIYRLALGALLLLASPLALGWISA